MLRLRRRSNFDNMLSSRLFDQNSFYQAFIDDLNKAKNEVIIESPFITAKRMAIVLPLLSKLTKRGVRVVVNTKPLDEHEFNYRIQAKQAIDDLQVLGILVLFTNGHHRKLAIIDKCITWEGSLNVLSQNDSCEVMRRMYSEQLANQMISFLHLEKFLG